MTDAVIDLGGKRALVTGGSRGVGRATALLLARSGADVGISYRSRHRDAEETVGGIARAGSRGWMEAGDLSRPDEVARLFRRVDEEFSGLDIFVGNAGIWPPEDVPLTELDEERWRRTLAVNLDSIYLTTREAARRMSDGGRIVLVSSTAGQRGEVGHADYAATKGAIISMVKGISGELAPREITVNAVAPGWIDTEMAAPALDDEGRRRIEEEIPLGRVAAPRDVAGPILFLCSDLARHITGEVVNVNGGAVLPG